MSALSATTGIFSWHSLPTRCQKQVDKEDSLIPGDTFQLPATKQEPWQNPFWLERSSHLFQRQCMKELGIWRHPLVIPQVPQPVFTGRYLMDLVGMRFMGSFPQGTPAGFHRGVLRGDLVGMGYVVPSIGHPPKSIPIDPQNACTKNEFRKK